MNYSALLLILRDTHLTFSFWFHDHLFPQCNQLLPVKYENLQSAEMRTHMPKRFKLSPKSTEFLQKGKKKSNRLYHISLDNRSDLYELKKEKLKSTLKLLKITKIICLHYNWSVPKSIITHINNYRQIVPKFTSHYMKNSNSNHSSFH